MKSPFFGYLLFGFLLLNLSSASSVLAQPAVVATAEGQIGNMPGVNDKFTGAQFEPLGGRTGEVILGGLFIFAGTPPPPPEFSFITDRLNLTPNPQSVNSFTGSFDNVFKLPPDSARSRNAADNNDFVVFSFALDGSMPDTMAVRIATFDESGQAITNIPIDNIRTFIPPFPGIPPDPSIADTAIAVDNQGRVTVVYSEFNTNNLPQIKAQRLDAVTGQLLGGSINIGSEGNVSPDIALLDPAGNRLLIPTTDINSNSVRAYILDTTGPTPLVLPEFPISTTPGLVNINPAVAADPNTGAFTVVWENITGTQGDPVDVRARRFDAEGNPIDNDFIVNTTTANTQGQPAVAYGNSGESAVVWAGTGQTAQDQLDVFAQVYDASGQPIGGEFRMNTQTIGEQSKPAVRWLPDPDAQGQPQFAAVWRDVVGNGDETPIGTGNRYRCFSIDDTTDFNEIFAEGFESGDTSSWCDSNP